VIAVDEMIDNDGAMNNTARAVVGDVELAYEKLGRDGDPPVLLVMGLGGQMHYWPDGFCRALTDRGLCVVRYDNRDVGLSTHLSSGGPVDLQALIASGGSSAPYGLEDLAADAIGLLGALGMSSAHLVGISLGGMIVQLAAIDYPERVRSLVSIASTTGEPSVGGSKAGVLAALLAPPGTTREEVTDHAVTLSRMIGSPGFDRDEQWLRWRAGHAYDRCYDPDGVSRQAAAALTASDRTERLGAVRVPALVVHGSVDPLVDVSGGQATAAAIPHADLLVIEGLGHDLPPGVWSQLADAIAATVQRGENGH
jgi:pimeloyl-ACP methyl ester carboxylesterase